MAGCRRSALRRRTGGLLVIGLVASLAPLLAPAPAGAFVIGAPSNATARTGDEDESAIAVNPNDNQQIAVMTNGVAGDNGLPLSFSTDGGATWTRTVFATGVGPGGDGRPAACCDPTLSWDDFGNLYVGYLQRTPRTIELYVTSDLGANFTNLGPVDTGAAGSLDQPTVVAAEGSVWVTWRDDSGGISARGRSVTGALTFGAWGAEQDVSTVGNFGDIAIGPTGEVMVVYQDPTGNEGPSTIFVHTDADGLGAGAFGAAVTVGTTNVGGFDFLPAQPQRSVDSETGLAWDRTGGANNDRIYLVYTEEIPAESNDMDILVRTSTNDGATWSGPVTVNDDAGTNSQMLPRIALDQTNGDVGVTFYDARGDTGGGPSATDIDGTPNNDVTLFATWTLDGGATWAANVAVADAPTDGYDTNGGQELGDYTGSAFHDGLLYPSWADSSNSTGDNPDGTLNTLDVYVAAVRPRNFPPVAVDDAYTTGEGVPLVVPAPGVLANDTDADGQVLTATLATAPANGTVVLNPDGSFTYTTTFVDFVGTDSFTYTASDGFDTDTATVTITVTEEIPPNCTITGTPGDDVLQGTPNADKICGLGGNDTLIGGAGDDILIGGSGNDRLEGGSGNDIMEGRSGNDVLIGGTGNDNMDGGSGDDRLEGGTGNDTMTGGPGADQLFGEGGNDTLNAVDTVSANDTSAGASGTDNCPADVGDVVTGCP